MCIRDRLYLVFGSTTAIKLTSVFRRKRLSKRLPAAKAPQDLLTGQQFSDEDLQVMQFNTNYNNSPVTCYDDYQLFITGETHYRALFQDIKEAKENIYVLFYAIHHDVMGEALVKIPVSYTHLTLTISQNYSLSEKEKVISRWILRRLMYRQTT